MQAVTAETGVRCHLSPPVAEHGKPNTRWCVSATLINDAICLCRKITVGPALPPESCRMKFSSALKDNGYRNHHPSILNGTFISPYFMKCVVLDPARFRSVPRRVLEKRQQCWSLLQQHISPAPHRGRVHPLCCVDVSANGYLSNASYRYP